MIPTSKVVPGVGSLLVDARRLGWRRHGQALPKGRVGATSPPPETLSAQLGPPSARLPRLALLVHEPSVTPDGCRCWNHHAPWLSEDCAPAAPSIGCGEREPLLQCARAGGVGETLGSASAASAWVRALVAIVSHSARTGAWPKEPLGARDSRGVRLAAVPRTSGLRKARVRDAKHRPREASSSSPF